MTMTSTKQRSSAALAELSNTYKTMAMAIVLTQLDIQDNALDDAQERLERIKRILTSMTASSAKASKRLAGEIANSNPGNPGNN